MIRDSLITDSRNFRFFNAGPVMLGPGPNCAGNCSILEARIGESLWPTSNDLQSDWTSKIPKNKYRYLFFVILIFPVILSFKIIKNLKNIICLTFYTLRRVHLMKFCLYLWRHYLIPIQKIIFNFAVQCWKCRNSQVASFHWKLFSAVWGIIETTIGKTTRFSTNFIKMNIYGVLYSWEQNKTYLCAHLC